MFFIYGDDNSGLRRQPVVLYWIISLNIAFYVFQCFEGDKITQGWSAVPYEITHGEDLIGKVEITFDGKTETIQHYAAPGSVYFTLLTAMFMHGSLGHIVGNMIYLFIFGDQIEDRLGKFRFTAFYFVSGLAAAVTHIAVDPDSTIPMLGASGAIAGVLGAYLVAYPKNNVYVMLFFRDYKWPAWATLLGWFAMQVLGEFGTGGRGIAYGAHIGGFLSGVALISVNIAGEFGVERYRLRIRPSASLPVEPLPATPPKWKGKPRKKHA